MLPFALALAVTAASSVTVHTASSSAIVPDVHRGVHIDPIEGLPADPKGVEAFQAAFDAAFASGSIASETRSEGEAWRASGSMDNAFTTVPEGIDEDAWRLHVLVGVPPIVEEKGLPHPSQSRAGEPLRRIHRASRGLAVSVSIWTPEQVRHAEEGTTTTTAVALAVPAPDTTGAMLVPKGGYDYPWSEAGRIAALLALERLHQASRTMTDDQRFDLSPALRVDRRR